MKRTILVTGANRGIGKELTRQLARIGYHVFLGIRSVPAGSQVASEINSQGGQATVLELDVTDTKSVNRATDEFGEHANCLDVLINNAAILIDRNGIPSETSEETLCQTYDTNVIGIIRGVHAFLPWLRKASQARIINFSSGAGQICDMVDSVYAPAYQISKTAVNAVTCLLASELKEEGIAVNALCPGWVQTEMGGSHATRPVEEGADTAIWLATQAPQNLTGKLLRDRIEIPW